MSRTSGERSSPNDIEMEAIILHVWIRWFVRLSRNFYVVVVPLKRKPGTIKNLINPDEMDMEEVQYVGGEKHPNYVPDTIRAIPSGSGSKYLRHILSYS